MAFVTDRFISIEEPLQYRLSIYNLNNETIKRYEFPNPPSHIDELLWSPNSQQLYFALNPGAPGDEPSSSYGLWRFNIQTGDFIQVTNLSDPFLHPVSISQDGQWILLMPERMQSVTYIHLPTGEQIVIRLPPDGVSRIVR